MGCAVRHFQITGRIDKILLVNLSSSGVMSSEGVSQRASHFKALIKPKNEQIFCHFALVCSKLSKWRNLVSQTDVVPRTSFLIILGLVKGVVTESNTFYWMKEWMKWVKEKVPVRQLLNWTREPLLLFSPLGRVLYILCRWNWLCDSAATLTFCCRLTYSTTG